MSQKTGLQRARRPHQIPWLLVAAIVGTFVVATVITGTTSWLNFRIVSHATVTTRDPQAAAILLARKVVDSQWSDGLLPYRARNNAIARSTPGDLFPSSISVGHFIAPIDRDNLIGRVLLPFLYLPDSNMFVTVQVLECLLDADRLGVVEVDEKVVLEAVEAVLDHRDRNQSDNAALFCFYSQERREDGSWRRRHRNTCAKAKIECSNSRGFSSRLHVKLFMGRHRG